MNSASQRIYDFLKKLVPFNYLDNEVLRTLCEHVEVQFYSKASRIFNKGGQPKDFFYIVREGAVDLLDVKPKEETLIEQCKEGEIFGIRPLLAGDAYQLRAQTAEDTLLYAIKVEDVKVHLDRYPKVAVHLASVMARGRGGILGATYKSKEKETSSPNMDLDSQLFKLKAVHKAKAPISCGPETVVFEAAEIMTEHDVNYILVVDDRNYPLGILTDRDIRRNIATGLFGRKRLIKEVMTTPVACISADITIAEIQIAMVKYEVFHLAITEDGTMNSPVVGLISEQDLLALQGNSPAILVREISKSRTGGYLRELREKAEELLARYLEQEVSVNYISTIMTAINSELISRCVELSLQEMKTEGLGNPPRKFSWMCLGSQGRGEQLLRTNQDNALVYEDDSPINGNPKEVKAWFLDLAERTTEKLYTVGFDYPQGEMTANNPSWCLTVAGWKHVFSAWMEGPSKENIQNVPLFFDYRYVCGDPSLTRTLTHHIFAELEHTAVFKSFLAKTVLKKTTPLTFLRNFKLEPSGNHKGCFDLKARAMIPLTDAARMLVLTKKVGGINNTIKRFQTMAELEPQYADIYNSAADAYEVLVRLRAIIGLRQGDNGRYVDPEKLTRMQRVLLKDTFPVVREIQKLLEIRFPLNYIR